MARLLQINVDGGRQAQDLAFATARELGADLLLLNEPYRCGTLADGWYCDTAAKAAIVVVNGAYAVEGTALIPEEGFTWLRVRGITVFCCYWSPNPRRAVEFDGFLARLDACVRGVRGPVIVAGDFNAKSPEWGHPVEDDKGSRLAELAASLRLAVLNRGRVPTFMRPRPFAQSCIDVSFASESIVSRIVDWEVLETESLSLHRYVSFSLAAVRRPGAVLADPRHGRAKGWVTGRGIDQVSFATSLRRARDEWDARGANAATLRPPEGIADALAAEFEEVVAAACDDLLPRRGSPPTGKRAVHWWTPEIARLRRESTAARRAVKRAAARAGRHSAVVPEDKLIALRLSRAALNKAISRSKELCWKELLAAVDGDPWGQPYKLVLRKLKGLPATAGMSKAEVERITDELFPTRPPPLAPRVISPTAYVPPLLASEVDAAVARIAGRRKAPGPDGISSGILAAVHKADPGLLLSTLGVCLESGCYPHRWKQGRLVLLRKGVKPVGEPSSYRPLCLLNDVGKLLEFILVRRLEAHLQLKGGLSRAQFGFRPGKSADDAGIKVREFALNAVNHMEMCVAVSLDIRNAFNSVGWEHVLDALGAWDVPPYIRQLMASYFRGRGVTINCLEGPVNVDVTCGVPQGSVLGPFLWNLTYDAVLRVAVPHGVRIIGFADDTLVIGKSDTSEGVEGKVNYVLDLVAEKIRSLGLRLAVNKTQAIMFKRKYKDRVPQITLEGEPVALSRTIKYLGVLFDDTLVFKAHITSAADKARGVLAALARLMPNVGGPKEPRRRLYAGVATSVMLYGSPVWGSMVPYATRAVKEMLRVQRRAALRVSMSYRTVSHDAALLIAGLPPIDLLAIERRKAYWSRRGGDGGDIRVETAAQRRSATLVQWQERHSMGTRGEWTRRVIGPVAPWATRSRGELDYHLTQLLTGHGCFASFLHRIGKRDAPHCAHCTSEVDDAAHTLLDCPAWNTERAALVAVLGSISPEGLGPAMLSSTEAWSAVRAFAISVMGAKGEEERRWEAARAAAAAAAAAEAAAGAPPERRRQRRRQ